MAHSLSAKKRVRQNAKHRAQNRARKADIRIVTKEYAAALGKGDIAAAEAQLRKVARKLDRTAAKGTIHKNAASRRRSRLARKLNAAKAAKAAAGTPATA